MLNSRPYQEDFWRVRNLLIETYPLTPAGLNWDIRHWDGWHTHRENPPQELEKRIRLWETDAGRLVGVVNPEGKGDAHFQIHPDYRHLIEEDMLAWAEENLSIDEGNQRRLDIFVFEYDMPRLRLVEKRGYEKMPWWGVTYRMRFGQKPLPTPVLAEGYVLRSTTDDDHQHVADVLNAGFNRTLHTAAEFKNFTLNSPSYRHALNLVAAAPDGVFAALVGITYDDVNRRGIFEPVCTHPDHRRKRLAQTLMIEGLHRLKALGAETVYVETGDMEAANALYESVGFTEVYRGYYWRKIT